MTCIADYREPKITMARLTKSTTHLHEMIGYGQLLMIQLIDQRPSGYQDDMRMISNGVEILRRDIKARMR